MIGPKKAELSARRDRSAELLEKMGMDGYLELINAEDKITISGEINGHSVILTHQKTVTSHGGIPWQKKSQRVGEVVDGFKLMPDGSRQAEFQGVVDGIKLRPEDVERFLEKYRRVWTSFQNEDVEAAQKEDVEMAQEDKVASGKVLRSIGL